jgi:predicted nucleic acid-binding protein
MKSYILDSDILIYFLNGKKDVVEQITAIPQDNLYITRINYAELFYGAYNTKRIEENLKTIIPFLDNFTVLEFDKESSEIFAKTKASLKMNGNIIADMDLMIASIALRHNVTLVSNNTKHFKRISKLKLENFI